jgi:hypothetical protein
MLASAALAVTDAARSSLGWTDPEEGAHNSSLDSSSSTKESEAKAANDENSGGVDSLRPAAANDGGDANAEEGTSLRRSGRERTSTRVYIDGNPVLAINNYVVKGGKYEYGKANADDHNPKKQPKPRQRPPPKSKLSAVAGAGGRVDGDDDEEGSPPATKKARRAVSTAEAGRRGHNARVDLRKERKQHRRNGFLARHANILEPFVVPGALRRMQSAASNTGPPEEEEEEYDEEVQQPKCILAEMRDYQLRGLNFMVRMHRQNLGMILADEMGLVRASGPQSALVFLALLH